VVVKPKVWNFICTNAHPRGCELNVLEQIKVVQRHAARSDGPKRALIIGASTGYGLAARITSAFGFGADTLGVFFEKPARGAKTATAGWYNSAAFDEFAKQSGLWSRSINGDAFSHATRNCAMDLIKREMGGRIDLVIYSLASPARKLPDSGEVVRTALKPIGNLLSGKTIDTDRNKLVDISVEPASEQEIRDTIAVMGGSDWALWIDALRSADLLANNAKTVAFSYVGPKATWPIYWHGTIGRAKQHLEDTADGLQRDFRALGLSARVAILKSVVTQASAAIPMMPLYISLVFRVMKDKGLHEGKIDQQNRLFREFLYREDGQTAAVDAQGRLRLDDRELRDDVQQMCDQLWSQVTDENLDQITDYTGYKREFLQLFGFDRPDVDYAADVSLDKEFDCIQL
jgi:enoyl-[acyl-carrier protein] reductase / trans-2-enoyl-CoA reductase (NAD+)